MKKLEIGEEIRETITEKRPAPALEKAGALLVAAGAVLWFISLLGKGDNADN